MNRVEPMGDATLDFASKGQEQRSFSSFALSPQDGSADLPLRRSDSLLSEKPTTTLRSSSRSLQRQNSERLQRSSSPQPNISSPKARNLQGAAFRTQALSATTASESLLRTLSSVPSSPKSVLPEVALPESSRFTPRARSLASSSGLLSSPRRAVFTRSATFSGRRKRQLWKNGGLLPLMFVLLWFALDWWFLSQFQEVSHQSAQTMSIFQGSFGKSERPSGHVYERLLSLAAHALAEGELQTESEDLWQEPFKAAAAWKPCADQRTQCYLAPPLLKKSSGYLMISANGGLNQQRIAVCNAVALARLLNATLVLPRFLFNSVWRDSSFWHFQNDFASGQGADEVSGEGVIVKSLSYMLLLMVPEQFGDIYQEDFFVEYLRADVQIVKDLPIELQSLDLEATGSLVTDVEVPKEATPTFYLINILPLLLRTGVVHLLGFGNRLAFDPIPFDIQRLRCRCNFHALKFLPKLEQIGVLIANRMRERSSRWGPLDDEFHPDGNGFMSVSKQSGKLAWKTPKYLALHLRFEMDMVAHSMCEFGGGEAELEELRAYRAIHFPTLSQFEQHGKLESAMFNRELGHCPLMPEEAVLMLAALGFKRGTRIFLAGAQLYGGQSRMSMLTSLYPNLVTKESLLTAAELAPFLNHSSQLAALDYFGCVAADMFAITDSGSQLSSLVAGQRIYEGGGHAPTIRPNKRRLASIFHDNQTIEWSHFEHRVRKAVKESQKIGIRPFGRSIYRYPRCEECMCKGED